MPPAESIARYFLHLAAAADEPALVSHMHLQKWLYYAQGWSLGVRGTPLFPDRIEAWAHGPVVPSVYRLFADYGSQAIAPHEAGTVSDLGADDRRMVEWVWSKYARYSALHLRNLTHAESPWAAARAGVPDGAPGTTAISLDAMRDYFASRHRQQCAREGLDSDQIAQSLRDSRAGDLAPLSAAFD